ncbi:MAG: ECF transporter S component [Oscillospiraceae bacterium]
MTRKEVTKRIVRLGMLGALGVVLALIIHFPIFPAASYLEYDPADVPIFIAAFLYGPWYGVALTVVVSFIQGFTVSGGSGIVGVVMHIAATGAFCAVAGNIYRIKKTHKTAVAALILGSLTMVAVMCVMNYLITPLFSPGVTRETVLGMLLPIIVPFNLIKAGINSAVTMLIYKPVRRVLEKN